MRRFFSTVSVSADPPYTVTLDGKPIRTPQQAALALPSKALADAIAAEWDQPGETVDLTVLGLTRLANVAIDRTPAQREALIGELVRYCETDLVCHLAEGPADLRARQDQAFSPLRAWAAETLDIALSAVEGIIARPQPESALNAARQHAEGLCDFRLTGLIHGCGLFGSAVLALALERGHLDGETALLISCIDEDWQAERWGQDAEAQAVFQNRRRDVQTLATWFRRLEQ